MKSAWIDSRVPNRARAWREADQSKRERLKPSATKVQTMARGVLNAGTILEATGQYHDVASHSM